MAKKTALVQPPPSKPKPAPPEMISIEKALRLAGNVQPYTIIAKAVDHWIVHFAGDFEPSMLIQVKGKWTIVKK